MIETKKLSKEFRIYKKQPGLSGTVKSFFHREYSQNIAVNELDLQIAPGEFVGLLGPNGAGKTTVMKMLTGIIVPSSGEMRVLGFHPSERKKEFRKKIALVMGQKSQLWWDIPAMDSLLLLQKYYEIPESEFKKRWQDLADILGIMKQMNVQVRKLSLGERMKLEVLACLLHRPEVIFLDEPTIGLDVIAQKNIREFLIEYHRREKATIILTSHYMADIDALCQRIVLILSGNKRFDGSKREFSQILGKEKSLSFSFRETPREHQNLWNDLHPSWSDSFTKVSLRVPEENIRKVATDIIQNFNVTDFSTEAMPIERVLATLVTNPELLKV